MASIQNNLIPLQIVPETVSIDSNYFLVSAITQQNQRRFMLKREFNAKKHAVFWLLREMLY